MNKITVNGKTIFVEGNNVSIVNGTVIVDGRKIELDCTSGPPKIIWEGNLANLSCDKSVECGDVHGDVKARGSVTCQNVSKNVDAGGSIQCGNVGGNVDAGGSVQCGNVSGNVDAGGSIKMSR